MKKKLNLKQLEVQSFITSTQSIKGGAQTQNGCASNTCYTINIDCITVRCSNTLNPDECIAVQLTKICV